MSTSVLASPSRSKEDCSSRSSEILSSPLPEWIWSDVEHLYQSVFSSRVMIEKPDLTHSLPYAWVERNEYQITSILLFRMEECAIQVMNEVITLASDVIERFSKDIFSNYSKIQFIRLHAIKFQTPIKNYICSISEFSEDYILTIPQSKECWLASLSSRTREHLRFYTRQVEKDKTGISSSISQRDEIDESDIRYLLKLNHDRMKSKGKLYGISNDEENKLCLQMKSVGCLFLLKKKGQICAGLICSVVDRDIYIHVLAHDTRYDAMRLGWICCCQAIDHFILQKFQRIHFLWGHYDYKIKLGAKPVKLYRILIIRNFIVIFIRPKILIRWCCNVLRDSARKYRHRLAL